MVCYNNWFWQLDLFWHILYWLMEECYFKITLSKTFLWACASSSNKEGSEIASFLRAARLRNIVIVMTKGKIRKNEVRKMHLFLLPPPRLSLSGGVGCCSPHPPSFFHCKIFWISFFSLIHGYLDKGWANGPNDNPSRKAKTAREKIRKGEGRCDNRQPLLRGLKKLSRLRIHYTSQVRSKIIMFTFQPFQHWPRSCYGYLLSATSITPDGYQCISVTW